jgi:mannose/fructose/N-acetylgalactosamine-specific phosphotransferase system component IIB
MIHGQCIVRVLGDFKIARIIGVDDFTAGNAVLKRIYEMAMPPHVTGGIYTAQDAIAEIEISLADNKNTLVLVKNPQTALALFKSRDGMPKELNIGPMSSRKGAAKATMYAYLTDEEVGAVDEMASMGIRVYFNQTIDQKTEEWANVKSRL